MEFKVKGTGLKFEGSKARDRVSVDATLDLKFATLMFSMC